MRAKIILSLCLLVQVISVQSQEFNWATAVSGEEYEYGVKAIEDAQGNTYFIGYSTGSPFEYNGVAYPAFGRGDAFFAKLDTTKQLVWMKSIGGNDSIYFDEALDIHIDTFGDIYLTFKSSGNNFTYDGQVLSGINSPGQYSGEAVLLKVNSDGTYIWHDSGTVSSSFQRITTDANGNLYITGFFRSTITLGSTITLINPSPATTTDLLVAKYQPNGTILWAKNAGGMPHNTFAYGYDIEINPQTNELIVLGKGDGAVFFDGVPMPLNGTSDEGTVLISYNLDGTQNWVKRVLDAPNNSYSTSTSLGISPSGIMGVCGYLFNSNALVGFYTSDGSIISEHLYTSPGQLRIFSLVFNEFNEAYLSGWCTIGAVLGASPGTAIISNSSGFIAKVDLFQHVKWVTEFQASGFRNQVHYTNGKILYAGRIDDSFIYNSGEDVIINNYGDAIFGEIIDFELPSNRSAITGTVFHDLDANCLLNPTDVGQKSIVVVATDDNGSSHFSISNSIGHYAIPVDEGTYTVEVFPNPIQSSLLTQNCIIEQDVIITEMGQVLTDIHFPIELANCPLLAVDLCSDRRRRCFESNTYVNYSNSGFAEEQAVEVTVQFPEYVTFISSSHTYNIDSEGRYVFAIGTLAPNESGVIHIVDYTECIEGITGLTQCTEAWITPANDCAFALDPDYDDWDNSLIRIKGSCFNNTLVQFIILNTAPNGEGNMQTPREYRIYVDNALALTSTFQLAGGESVIIEYPANGQTIRLEADQHPLYPGNSQPQQTTEGCGGANNEISRGFVDTMGMGDEDVDIEIQCLEIIDSFDPNDKLVSPSGITENNFVKAGTTLDYMIRFQNTGTDTAYTVIVKDSLSPYLDPSSLQWGVSSHPYEINIKGTEIPILEFIFNNINLPDSTANELGSHGFVKFKATTYSSLENGIQINNNASIYFDYNLPILTNTVQITVSDFVLFYDPLMVATFREEDIIIYPNPTSGLLKIESNSLQHVEVYTMSGILIANTNKNEVDLSQQPKGIYFMKISTHEGIALKKIVVK